MVAGFQPDDQLTDYILDQILCPVARMRLLSDGMHENTRLLMHEQTIGDKACLACGNCVDACPVVAENHGFITLPNQRTSMALEHMVGLECRRCYRCIQSCPQVSKSIKEHAAGFRRGEKIIHLLVATSIVMLALSGMALSHYRDILPSVDIFLVDAVHRILGLILMALPFLYILLDKSHFKRWIKKVFIWHKYDWLWLKKLGRHIKASDRYPVPDRGEFNPGQKAWYAFVSVMIPFMAISGLILLVGFKAEHTAFYRNIKLLHMSMAFITDVLLALHIYLKYIRNWGLKIFAMIRSYKEKRHLNYYVLYK